MELLEEDLRDGRVDLADAQLQVDQRPPRAAAPVGAGGRAARPQPPRRRGAAALGARRAGRAGARRRRRVRPARQERDDRARRRPARRTPAGAAATPTRSRASCGSCSTTRCATARRASRCASPTHGGRRRRSSVADRGPGVPPEEREHIFERFHRGRDAGRRERLRARPGDRPRARPADGRHAASSPTSRPGARFVLDAPRAEPETSGAARGAHAVARYARLDEHRRVDGVRPPLDRKPGSLAATAKRGSLPRYCATPPTARARARSTARPAADVVDDGSTSTSRGRAAARPAAAAGRARPRSPRGARRRRASPSPRGRSAATASRSAPPSAGSIEHGHLLGLRREHDVAGREARRDRLSRPRARCSCRPADVAGAQCGRHAQRRRSRAGRRASPAATAHSSGATADRQVAVRPRRRELRRQPGEQHGRAPRSPAGPAAERAGSAAVAGRSSAASPAPDEQQRDLRDWPSRPPGVPSSSNYGGALRPRRARVGRLVERVGQPRQVQQRARRRSRRRGHQQPRRAARGRAQRAEEPGRRRRRRRRRAPSCGCRASWRA